MTPPNLNLAFNRDSLHVHPKAILTAIYSAAQHTIPRFGSDAEVGS